MNTDAVLAIKLNVPELLFQSIADKPQILFDLFAMDSLEEVKVFLFDQLKDKDGAPEFADFQVHSFHYDVSTGQGSFRLKFTINRRFCCADTEACQMDYLDFDFSYSQECISATAHYFNWSIDN